MNSPNKIGDYFSRRFPFFTIFSNASYPELAYISKLYDDLLTMPSMSGIRCRPNCALVWLP